MFASPARVERFHFLEPNYLMTHLSISEEYIDIAIAQSVSRSTLFPWAQVFWYIDNPERQS